MAFTYDPLLIEVDDDLRREKMRTLWRALGSYIIAVTTLILLGTIAIVAWQRYLNSQAEALTSQLLDARHLAQRGREEEALAQLDAVIAAKHTTLSPLAQLWAAEMTAKGSHEQHQKYLSMPNFLVKGDPYEAFAQLLLGSKGADPSGPFRLTAQEIHAVSLLKAGKTAEAAAAFRALSKDAEAPSTLRRRVQLILSSLPDEDSAPVAAPTPAASLTNAHTANAPSAPPQETP